MENENAMLKEDIVKAKELIQTKDQVIVTNTSRINTVKEDLKAKSERVKILEPVVNRILKNEKTTGDPVHRSLTEELTK